MLRRFMDVMYWLKSLVPRSYPVGQHDVACMD
jgi:hypothetical protein